MILVGQVSDLDENFNVGVFRDINVINVKLCMMVLHIELYLFMLFSVTFALFQNNSISNGFN